MYRICVCAYAYALLIGFSKIVPTPERACAATWNFRQWHTLINGIIVHTSAYKRYGGTQGGGQYLWGTKYILLEEIGYPALAGVALITFMMPLQCKFLKCFLVSYSSNSSTFITCSDFVGKYSGIFRLQAAELTDERARFMSEIINGIRVLKMYAWEQPFSNLVHRLR